MHSYRENGWTLEYAKVAYGLRWVHYGRVFPGGLGTQTYTHILNANHMPFKPIANTLVPGLCIVSHTIVSTCSFEFTANDGIYFTSPAHGTAIEIQVQGIIPVKEE